MVDQGLGGMDSARKNRNRLAGEKLFLGGKSATGAEKHGAHHFKAKRPKKNKKKKKEGDR